eukprot:6087036-Alexandrium_andersonii.AAC.1
MGLSACARTITPGRALSGIVGMADLLAVRKGLPRQTRSSISIRSERMRAAALQFCGIFASRHAATRTLRPLSAASRSGPKAG